MRKLFIISLLLLEIGCDNTIPSDLTLLNGYWEIDYITHKNETFDPKGASRLLDFYEISEKTGVRKKVQPQLNNKFLVTDDINTFDIILQNKTFDCFVALGVVIKGTTSHHHLVAEASGHALQKISLQYHIPVINGIVVTDDIKSAEDRITGHIDRGLEFAEAALHMAQLHKKWTKI